MRQTLLLLTLVSVATAHGGAYLGPNGSVPPGLRGPADPEPPPPPPMDARGFVGPVNPAMPRPGKFRNGPEGKYMFESWVFWWAYNTRSIIRRAPPLEATPSNEIAGALRAILDDPKEHEDLHGAALIALGKCGAADALRICEKVLAGRRTDNQGAAISYGWQARESAVLALGLLPDPGKENQARVRARLAAILKSQTGRSRDRAWAAVGLGLQGDPAAIPDLTAILKENHPADQIPAACVVALGLIGDGSVRAELESGVVRGQMFGKRLSTRVQSSCVYAIGKIGDPNSFPAVMHPIKSRRAARLVRRAAALAVGAFAATAAPADQDDVLNRLDRLSDPSAKHFACISRGRMATKESLTRLLDLAESGAHKERAFAALGLAVPAMTNRPYPAGWREKAVVKLRALAADSKAYDIKAAQLIALGAMKDEKAWPLMKGLTGRGNKRRGDLRAHACLAMGLLGEPKEEIRALLRKAMGADSYYVRGCAATGLAYIGDPRDEGLLLDEFESAQRFGYQGQIAGLMRAVGGVKTRDRCLAVLKDRKFPTRTRALAAAILGEIADPRAVSPLARIADGYNYRASVMDLDEVLYIL